MTARSTKKMSTKSRFFLVRIFPMIFIIVGGLALFFGGRNILRAKASSGWPTTQGVINNSSVEYHSGEKGRGTYRAEINYEFKVNETTFRSDRIAFGVYGSSSRSRFSC